MFIHVAQDNSLDSCVIQLTPATAAKLGHWLINVAAQVEMP